MSFARRVRATALWLAVAAAWMSAAAPAARACGQCVEDKVAATYDFAVMQQAARVRHVVVFTEIRGRVAGAGPVLKAAIARALAGVAGVDAGTVRVSTDPPAASFACDPAHHSPEVLLKRINARLAAQKLGLALLKIERGVPRPPPRAATGT